MKVSLFARFVSGILGACALAATGSVGAGGPASFGDRPAADDVEQLIVRLTTYEGDVDEQGIGPHQMARLERAAGVRLQRVRDMSGNARVLGLPGPMSAERARKIAERIGSLPFVVYAVPDQMMQIQAIPNDPRYIEQWHYYEGVGGIELPDAWDITTGEPDVYVAVIDTGIRGDHEDLAGRWMGGYDFISGRFNAADRDGRDPDPTDPGDRLLIKSSSWHGSHVSGTIGAASDNGIGVAGVNWVSKIVPVRVLGRIGGTTSDILDGMRWAAGLSVPGVDDNEHPVDVMNLSLGGGGSCNAAWQSAVDDVVATGAVVVVAAGNSSAPASGFVPASCDDVITVAATNRSGDLAFYSNHGSAVEVSAPGGETSTPGDGVLSTLDAGKRRPQGDDYGFYQGTSMASPHVTGVVSLLKSVDPTLTPAEILEAIQNSAKPFPAGSDCDLTPDLCGAGIIDATAALNYVK